MRNPAITLANDSHRRNPAVRVSFEKYHGHSFRLNLQKIHLSTQSGFVTVSFGRTNEEINVTLNLHSDYRDHSKYEVVNT